MQITNTNLSEELLRNDMKLNTTVVQLQKLIDLLNDKQLPDHVIAKINAGISEVNAAPLSGKALLNLIRRKQSKMISLLEKEVKIVPVNYYRNLWIALGMTAFGLPIGVALGLSLGNMAFLGVGLPMGFPIGMAIGMAMDKKAKEEGRQLDIEIK